MYSISHGSFWTYRTVLPRLYLASRDIYIYMYFRMILNKIHFNDLKLCVQVLEKQN